MGNHKSEYVGRHRKNDPPTVPFRVIRFINERYRTGGSDHLFTHPTGPLHITDLQENPK